LNVVIVEMLIMIADIDAYLRIETRLTQYLYFCRIHIA
jgi:hypothetical protein